MKYAELEKKILKTGARLFFERGYCGVTMGDIAAAVNRREVEVKKFFSSPRDLRRAVNKRYLEIHTSVRPKKEDVLKVAQKQHPHETLKMLNYKLPKEESEFLLHAFLGALQDVHFNEESRKLININTIDNSFDNVKNLLDYLIDIKRIEPMDTHEFARTIAFLAFPSTIFDRMMEGTDEWEAMVQMLLQLVKPISSSFGEQL